MPKAQEGESLRGGLFLLPPRASPRKFMNFERFYVRLYWFCGNNLLLDFIYILAAHSPCP